MVQPLGETVTFLTKLNIFLPYSPAVAFLGVCPKELKVNIHTKACPQIFAVALFITDRTRKQPRCLSVGEWIISWSIQTVGCYSFRAKKKRPSSHGKPWRSPGCILLSGRSQSEKTEYWVIQTLTFWKRQNCETVRSVVGVQGWGGEQVGPGGFPGQCPGCVWCCGAGHMSSHIGPKQHHTPLRLSLNVNYAPQLIKYQY